jgi:hypothetical protein
MLGRLVVPPAAAVCDIAVPPRPSSNDAELERRSVLLVKSVIGPIPEKAARFVLRIREHLPSKSDGLISIPPGRIGHA